MAVHTGKSLILTTVNSLETRAIEETFAIHVVIGIFGINYLSQHEKQKINN